ncbi:galactokinase [bacterium]|nr:galactokinase [bacterium]
MSILVTNVVESFKKQWSIEPQTIAAAPGRVNLIGEHTDYTGGFVLPAAIDREIVLAAARVPGKTISGYSIDFDEEASCETGNYDPGYPSGWFRYVMGVLSELEKSDRTVGGFRFAVGGNVPIGSGLSSSAAIEMATLTAMEGLMGFRMDDVQAALLCQRAENGFVGMNCGIMDQYISRTGKKDHAVLIDCTDLSHRMIPINTPGFSWLVIDSKKKRGLVDSEYNRRRTECEEGAQCARAAFPGRNIRGLRNIDVADLPLMEASCTRTVFKRVRHIVTENSRVMETVNALKAGDTGMVGRCLYGSHASLRDDFEVSCEELDTLVDILSGVEGVSGARLTGAGFGGCVIAFLKESAEKAVEEAVSEQYHPKSLPKGTRADIWPITISDGARIIRN